MSEVKAPGTEAMSDMKKLETLVGAPIFRTVTVETIVDEQVVLTDHRVMIRQVKTGTIPKLIQACGSLLILLTTKTPPGQKNFDVTQMVLAYPGEALEVLSVLIERDRAFVDSLEMDDSVMLLGDCLEMNVDFFVQRILPRLSGGIRQLISKMQAKGIDLAKLVGTMQPSTS